MRLKKTGIKYFVSQKYLVSIASPNVCNGIFSVTNRSDVVINRRRDMFNQKLKMEKTKKLLMFESGPDSAIC